VEREREIGALGRWSIGRLTPSSTRKSRRRKSSRRALSVSTASRRVATGKDKDGKDQFVANALPDEKSMKTVVAALDKAQWSLASVQSTEKQRRPQAPFITSQLQRDAASKAGLQCAPHDGRGAAAL